MAAGVELAAAGTAVTVYEAGAELGGRARRVRFNDVLLDNGLHILLGAYRETLRLIELVVAPGIPPLTRLPLQWHMFGELDFSAPRWPAPLHLLAALLGARGLAAGERWAAVRFMSALRASSYSLASDTSVDALLGQHAQPARLRELLWHPLCVAALNTPPARASAQVFAHVLRDSLGAHRAASDLLISRVDLSALFPEPAGKFIEARGGEVLTERRVTAIERAAHGFDITADETAREFTHVICAIAPHQVGSFLHGISALAGVTAQVAALNYEPIFSVWLQYDGAVKMPSPMLGCTASPLHWAFDRHALCGQHGLVGAVISASGAHQDYPQQELALIAHRELERLLGDLPRLAWHRVIAEKRATFACTLGLVRPANLTPLQNFYLAGDYTAGDYPATLEAAVRSGVACAAQVVAQQ